MPSPSDRDLLARMERYHSHLIEFQADEHEGDYDEEAWETFGVVFELNGPGDPRLLEAWRQALLAVDASRPAFDRHADAGPPTSPTHARPGTPGKIEELRRRAWLRQSLWCKGDAPMSGEAPTVYGWLLWRKGG